MLFRLLVCLGCALVANAGCANKGQSVDCPQACSSLDSCAHAEFDVDSCHDLCAATEAELHDELSRCTDCLDASYNCSEIAEKCPVCTDVSAALVAGSQSSGGAAGSGG